MLISISDHESFWGGVSDWEGWGAWGGSHLCVLLSDLSKSMVGGEFPVLSAASGAGPGNLFNPGRFKMCSRGWKVRPAVQGKEGWEKMMRNV